MSMEAPRCAWLARGLAFAAGVFAVAAFADLKSAEPGDPCPKCGKPLEIVRGIEVEIVVEVD